MTMSVETIRSLLDNELSLAIERVSARIVELERDLAALKEERDRRALKRRRAAAEEAAK
jgi:hypothetical protein